MVSPRNLLRPAAYARRVEWLLLAALRRLQPSYKSAVAPGSYYSPLLDMSRIEESARYDGADLWEFIDLREAAQRDYFRAVLDDPFAFPRQPAPGRLYHSDNGFFGASDALTLAGIIRKERPRRIVEIGSGFSSALMIDAIRAGQFQTELTFVDPNPERLMERLDAQAISAVTILRQPVQELPMALYETLAAGDILFIDSSHVAKIGSDVAWLYLRVLPRLRPGVLVHIHDIFYPHSYPAAWQHAGYAWNESLFLRALLVGNPGFEIVAFNSYAQACFPDLFRERCPQFLEGRGQSIWLRRTGAAPSVPAPTVSVTPRSP